MSKKTDPAILFVKPGAISDDDKALLRDASIIVVQIENPADVKFTRAAIEIDGNELLREALAVINTVSGDASRTAMCHAFGAVLERNSK